MATKNQNVEIYAGNDVKLDISLTDSVNDPVDLTGAIVRWALASAYDPGLALVTKSSLVSGQVTITDAASGLVQVNLTSMDTASLGGQPYVHEAEIIDTINAKMTVLTGTMTIIKTALQ